MQNTRQQVHPGNTFSVRVLLKNGVLTNFYLKYGIGPHRVFSI